MDVRELLKGIAAMFVSLLIFLVLLEVTLQIYTRLFIYYDVEMSRYATEVKEKAENPKIGHVQHTPTPTTNGEAPIAFGRWKMAALQDADLHLSPDCSDKSYRRIVSDRRRRNHGPEYDFMRGATIAKCKRTWRSRREISLPMSGFDADPACTTRRTRYLTKAIVLWPRLPFREA